MQDKKLLEEYKAENDNLKALKMPSQETEFKHLDNQYKDEVNALKEKLENLQEQIKDHKKRWSNMPTSCILLIVTSSLS